MAEVIAEERAYTVIEYGAHPYTLIDGGAMQTVEAGSTVLLDFTLSSGETVYPVLVDPTSAQILLQRPDGSEAVALTALTKLAVGRYRYIRQTGLTDMTGTWVAACKTVRNTYVNWKTIEAFTLVKGQGQ